MNSQANVLPNQLSSSVEAEYYKQLSMNWGHWRVTRGGRPLLIMQKCEGVRSAWKSQDGHAFEIVLLGCSVTPSEACNEKYDSISSVWVERRWTLNTLWWHDWGSKSESNMAHLQVLLKGVCMFGCLYLLNTKCYEHTTCTKSKQKGLEIVSHPSVRVTTSLVL